MKDKGGAVWIARQCRQIFMTAFSTLDPCEAVMQDAAVQVSIDDLLYVGS